MGLQSIDMEGLGEMIWFGGMLGISGSQESHPQAAFAFCLLKSRGDLGWQWLVDFSML